MAASNRVQLEHRGWTITAERWPMIDEKLADEWRDQIAALSQPPPKSCGDEASSSTTTTTTTTTTDSATGEESRLPIQLLPEMMFDRNTVRLELAAADFGLSISLLSALKEWAERPLVPVKVAAAKHWAKHRSEFGSDPTVEWTFSTRYRGDFYRPSDGQPLAPNVDKAYSIDFELLKRQDPILLFCELVLFEDELADNGTSTLSCKIRLMPTCFYVLMRFWCRVDDVLFRVFDTRIFHKFGSSEVVRDFQWHESTFDQLRSAGKLPADPTRYSDENFMLQFLDKKQHITDGFDL